MEAPCGYQSCFCLLLYRTDECLRWLEDISSDLSPDFAAYQTTASSLNPPRLLLALHVNDVNPHESAARAFVNVNKTRTAYSSPCPETGLVTLMEWKT